ncbi:MAG: hypothetical protein JO076_10660 [Verrucomicrobia bacterium]|nr:hypothetical protein [Verrucomicrobiota bacterium]
MIDIPPSQQFYRAVYAYPWDLVQEEPSRVGEILSEQGISAVTIALSYHAGKFISPRSKVGRIYFPEDGAVYFNPTLSRYSKIKPYLHPEPRYREVAIRLSEASGLAVSGWVVLFHNTRLGSTYPDTTVRNAWGDRYVYSLCPVNPLVADFAEELVNDIAATIPLKSMVVETPGFLPYPHGYHHEFAQMQTQRWIELLLGLCFCDHCLHESRRDAGIDSHGLRVRVAKMVDDYLESPCEVPPDMAFGWIIADMLHDLELAAFLRWRVQRVSALVKRLRATMAPDIPLAVIPTVQRPTSQAWLEGSSLKELVNVADFLEIPFYEPTASRAIADAWDSLRRVGSSRAARIRAILRPGPPDLSSGSETEAAVKGLAELGIRDFAFYNWGLLRRHDFARIGEALKGIAC